MNWRKLVYAEGHKLEHIKRGRDQEETIAKNVAFQKMFLPLFDKLNKNKNGDYIDPVWNKRNGWHCDEILSIDQL